MNILTTTSSFRVPFENKQYSLIKNPYQRRLTEEEVGQLIERYQPIALLAGVEPLTKKVLERANNLKVISRVGIGLDSVDIDYANKMGIKVFNTPDAPTTAVAELTLGMMLALLRQIPLLDQTARKYGKKGPMGYQLCGKTVGIIGVGRIGSRVGSLCNAFGCKVIGYHPRKKEHPVMQLKTMEEVLTEADIISLHLPLTCETENMMSKENISKMKKNSMLINMARGGIVDEEALYQALLSKHLSGAALDCFKEEPYHGPLLELEQVILSSHMGSSTVEGRISMEKEAVANMMKVLKNS